MCVIVFLHRRRTSAKPSPSRFSLDFDKLIMFRLDVIHSSSYRPLSLSFYRIVITDAERTTVATDRIFRYSFLFPFFFGRGYRTPHAQSFYSTRGGASCFFLFWTAYADHVHTFLSSMFYEILVRQASAFFRIDIRSSLSRLTSRLATPQPASTRPVFDIRRDRRTQNWPDPLTA